MPGRSAFKSSAALFATILCFATAPAAAQTVLPKGFLDEPVVTGLDLPIAMTFLPDGRFLFIEQLDAEVKVHAAGAVATVGRAPNVNSGHDHRGLLALAVDPQWPVRPYLYLYWAYAPSTLRLSMFTVHGALADPTSTNLTMSSEYAILADIPDNNIWHNGGSLHFGPDGMLYLSVGDDSSPCAAQNQNSLLGKVLRLDVSGLPLAGSGPPLKSLIAAPGNPFAHPLPNSQLVWALGFRSPFRFDLDPLTGVLFVADVGLRDWEEIDCCTAPGQNFGWPWHEGPLARSAGCPGVPANPVAPTVALAHPDSIAIMSLECYRNPSGSAPLAFGSAYEGSYFFSDYETGIVRRRIHDGVTWSIAPPVPGQPGPDAWATGLTKVTDAAVGPDGALYYVRRELPSEIRRIRPTVAYPGNGADAAIELGPDGTVDRSASGIHFFFGGQMISARFYSPLGSLDFGTYGVGFKVFLTATPPPPFQLPGDPAASVWLPPTARLIASGQLLPGGVAFEAGPVPVVVAGLGLSAMMQLLASDPDRNLVGLGASAAHELVFP